VTWPKELPGVEVWAVAESARLWRVLHETFTVCSVLNVSGCASGGHADWTYRGRQYHAAPGGLMLMEPGEAHVTNALTGPGTFRVLQIPPRLVLSAAAQLGMTQPRLKSPSPWDPLLFRAFARLHASLERDDATLLERQSRFATCLTLMLERLCESTPPYTPATVHPAVQRAREYIHDHYASNVTLDVLEQVGGLSRFHLLRAFKLRTGLAPHQYLTQVRIAKARTALAAGIPPSAIELGFADQSHLTRHFKAVVGITPGRYACARAVALAGETARTFKTKETDSV
jgi:AraC-like DNA-binding protein